MDLTFLSGVGAFLIGLFGVLGVWQRRIDRDRKEKTLADLRDAQALGAHKAVAQYPQIKPYACIGCGSCVQACPEEGVLGLVNGIAHVILGSRCVGHARCQDACPVGAITVGLGDLACRPDIPVLSDELETSEPGIFIAGELGGMALIRHAVDQGSRAVDIVAARLRARREENPDVLDLVIVGAGPAGLAASLKAAEHRLRYLTISQDDIGGAIRKYPRRKLTLVQTVDIPLHGRLAGREYSKEELVALWDQLVRRHRLAIQTKRAFLSARRQGAFLEIQTSSGPLRSRFVLLALGRRGTPRQLGVPGEALEKVLYQLIDASAYTGRRVLVVGGGDSAIEIATALANQRGNAVTLSYRKEAFVRLKSRNEQRVRDYAAQGRLRVIYSSQVERIDAGSVALSVLRGARKESLRLENDFVFVAAGGEPPYPLLKAMGIRFGGAPDGTPIGAAA